MNQISLGYGIQLSIMSMLIVFVLLYIISLILESFKVIFNKKEDKIIENRLNSQLNQRIKEGITFEQLENDQDMLIAAMVASMEVAGENKESNYKILSIKQL